MRDEKIFNPLIISLLVFAGLVLIFNQVQIFALDNAGSSSGSLFKGSSSGNSNNDLSSVDINSIQSTAGSVAALFPIDKIKNSQDAMAIIFPTGTPEYGDAMGVSFDKPIESLAYMSKNYRSLKSEVEVNNPEVFKRFLNLASKPVGISCEYCCGVGPVGIDKRGNSVCGCQHNPAILYSALWLMKNTDMSDAEVLREALRWKALFFPKDMVTLATNLADGKVDVNNLPGMVGGC